MGVHVATEADKAHTQPIGGLDGELAAPMVEWAPMSIAEWVTNLTEGHWLEHEPDLEAFLTGPDTPR